MRPLRVLGVVCTGTRVARGLIHYYFPGACKPSCRPRMLLLGAEPGAGEASGPQEPAVPVPQRHEARLSTPTPPLACVRRPLQTDLGH